MRVIFVGLMLVALAANAASAGPCEVTPAVGNGQVKALIQAMESETREALDSAVGALVPKSVVADLAGVLARPGKLRERLDAAATRLGELAATPAHKDDPKLRELTGELRRVARMAEARRLEVKGSAGARTTSVAIRLANPPTTRLRLSLDGEHGGHAELEWDPAVGSPLVQRVDLADDKWAVSVTVEPTFIQQGEGSMVIATQFGELDEAPGLIALRGTHTALVGDRSQPDAKQIAMTGWPQPELTFRCGTSALESIDRIAIAPHVVARPSLQRANGAAPAIVTELLSIVAEIAVERARNGAMALLKDQLVAPLCTNAETRVTLKKLGLGLDGRDDPAFPLTCAALESMRLEDVLSSGATLLRSLRDDARRTILPAAVGKLAPETPAMRAFLQGVLQVLDRAVDRGSFDGLEIELVLDLVGSMDLLTGVLPGAHKQKISSEQLSAALQRALEIPAFRKATCNQDEPAADCARRIAIAKPTLPHWLHHLHAAAQAAAEAERANLGDLRAALRHEMKALLGKQPALRQAAELVCRARLAFAVVKRCAGAACSAARITEILSHPEAHFAEDLTFPAALCWTDKIYARTPEEVAWVQRLVIDGLALVQPARQTTSREQAVGAIRLVATVIAKIAPDSGAKVQRFTDVAAALIEERYDAVLTGLLELARMQKQPKQLGLRKLVALGGAVATYVSIYHGTKDGDAAAAREARKKSIESLIDAATDRHDRGGTGVVSLGSNVGAGYTFSTQFRKDAEQHELAVRVPLGIAYQRLPTGGREDAHGERPRHRYIGGHMALQLFDLGQFVRSDGSEATWSSFVAPGVELGFLFGSSSRTLTLTAHGSYAPTLTDDSTSGAWRVGVSLGYYVPLFDFN